MEKNEDYRNFSSTMEKHGFVIHPIKHAFDRILLNQDILWGASGPISFVREIAKNADFSSCGLLFFSQALHQYSHYLSYVKPSLVLNQERFLTTFADLAEGSDSNAFRLAETAGWSKIFVRPNQCLKVFEAFTGDIYALQEMQEKIALAGKFASSHTLCVVSPYQEIAAEYRFLCDTSGVVTCSRYIQEGEICIGKEDSVPLAAFDLANEIARDRRFRQEVMDELIVLDVARVGLHTYKLIEANCFSTSGLYACNLDRIAEAIKAEMERYKFSIGC